MDRLMLSSCNGCSSENRQRKKLTATDYREWRPDRFNSSIGVVRNAVSDRSADCVPCSGVHWGRQQRRASTHTWWWGHWATGNRQQPYVHTCVSLLPASTHCNYCIVYRQSIKGLFSHHGHSREVESLSRISWHVLSNSPCLSAIVARLEQYAIQGNSRVTFRPSFTRSAGHRYVHMIWP